MEIDIDIDRLRTALQPTIQPIVSLHNQGRKQKKEVESLRAERKVILSKMTWIERTFNGLFGGDREKIGRSKWIEREILGLRKQLFEVDKGLKVANTTFDRQLTEYLK